MGDRTIVYPGEIMQDFHILAPSKNAYIADAKLAAAILGTTQIVNGFACTPTAPAGMTVNVAPGEIYSLQFVDTTAYGTISLDTTNQIVKQGILLTTTNISCPAPVVVGTSINYLIQAIFVEQDTGSTVLPYYNPSDINNPYSGPNNTNVPQNVLRQNTALITVKAGVAATTGTQTTPNPDTNNVGLWVVTVAYGATSIISGNISQYSAASFIQETLTQKISQPTADLRYAQIVSAQNGTYQYAVDSSVSANTVTASLNPVLPSYTAGLAVKIKIANTNTGASTINLNGLGAKSILLSNGSALNPGDLVLNHVANLVYNGTNFEIQNPGSQLSNGYALDIGSANTYSITLSPALPAYYSGFKINVLIANTNTGASTLNVNGLGTKNILRFNGLPVVQNDIFAGMVATFVYNGTAFVLLNPSTSNNNILYGYVTYATTTQQTVAASNVPTKVLFDSVVHDPNSWWSVSNKRFLPTIAGAYRLTWTLHSYGTAGSNFFSTLYKNGTKILRGTEGIAQTSSNSTSFGSAIFQANGSTDYFELYANCLAGITTTMGYDTAEFANIDNAFFIEYLGSYI